MTAGTIANSALATADDTSLKDQKALTKGIRKKMMDPESIKLREQKQKENRLQRESDNLHNAQSTFSEFIGTSKPKEVDDALYKPMTTSAQGKGRRFITKDAVSSIIGPMEEVKKQLVIMSGKDVTESQSDVYTSVPKKIVLKDLLTVMKKDARLRNKALHYSL